MTNAIFTVDPDDYEGLTAIMDNHYMDNPFFGTNENGENVIIEVVKDSVTVKTFQSNGWERINTYYRDGSIEELYER